MATNPTLRLRLSLLVASALVVVSVLLYTSFAATIIGTNFSTDGNSTVLGNLIVGNGTPGVTQNGEDAYVEGTLEVDGAVTLDGAVAAGSTLAVTSTTTLTGAATLNGALTANSTAALNGTTTYTFDASEKLLIDASTTDHTDTAGVIDLNVDAGAVNASAINVAYAIQDAARTGDTVAGDITVTGPASGLSATGGAYGINVTLVPDNSDASSAEYFGAHVEVNGAVGSAADINGLTALLGSDTVISGTGGVMGVNVVGNVSGGGDVRGLSTVFEYSGTPGSGLRNLTGNHVELTNNSTTLQSIYGVYNWIHLNEDATNEAGYMLIVDSDGTINTLTSGLEIKAGSGNITNGIRITDTGATGRVTNGIVIQSSSAAMTTAIDVSDSDIVTALSIGANPIRSGGTVTFDRADSGTVTLTAADDNANADLMIDPGGTGNLLLDFQQADLGGSCTAGTVAIDNGGATRELCFCRTANTWTCWNASTNSGPTD